MTKDPEDIRPRTVDWSRKLPTGVTITGSVWLIDGPDASLTLGTDEQAPAISDDGDMTSCWLLGGTLGASYLLTNRVNWSDGQQRDRTVTVLIRRR